MGGLGIRKRGSKVLGAMLEQPDVQFVAIADVRADRRAAVKKMADDKYGNDQCDTYVDMHELLDRDDIDAVVIATGDRWHAPAAICVLSAATTAATMTTTFSVIAKIPLVATIALASIPFGYASLH